ncbi:MAG: hypothetical protein ACPGOY_07215 [Rhodospirillaceae bacterium]
MMFSAAHPGPTVEDYLALFSLYEGAAETAYRAPIGEDTSEDKFLFLFNQVIRLMQDPSPFNAGLPESFLRTARALKAQEEDTVKRMDQPDNRHFFLSDFHDYLQLTRLTSGRRQA